MAKGYSIRYAAKYGKHYHSSSIWDDHGYTRTWNTIDETTNYAIEFMNRVNADKQPEERGHIKHCKIYLGREYIKTIDCDGQIFVMNKTK